MFWGGKIDFEAATGQEGCELKTEGEASLKGSSVNPRKCIIQPVSFSKREYVGKGEHNAQF